MDDTVFNFELRILRGWVAGEMSPLVSCFSTRMIQNDSSSYPRQEETVWPMLCLNFNM